MKSTIVTIANGESLSGASAYIGKSLLCGLETDSAWDANVITLQVICSDGSTAKNVYSEDALSGEFSTGTVAASIYVPISNIQLGDIDSLKVRSGTAASAVNQVGATVITIHYLPL